MMSIIESIDARIGEVRTESLDMSVGEIIGLHQQKELVIQPDFQRLFRWSFEQRSRLVESLLLDLPIPSIFLIEREDGVLELIDGLQRISSLLHFIDSGSMLSAPKEDYLGPVEEGFNIDTPTTDDQQDAVPLETNQKQAAPDPLVLEGCDLVKDLNGLTFDNLPLTLRLRLKRTAIRAVIIKRQSSQFLRYEMFKRLNTGGSKLSDQDIRNVNARMLGEYGAKFYKKLAKCANFPSYRTTISLLADVAFDTRMDEELVLRFFATKNFRKNFRGNVGDWLDAYMEEVLLGDLELTDEDIGHFFDLFTVLAEKLGPFAFVKYRGSTPVGGVAPAYFEAVSMGAWLNLHKLRTLAPEVVQGVVAKVVQSADFRKVTGPGANSLPKLESRIALIEKSFAEV